jgi:hypothetical protein
MSLCITTNSADRHPNHIALVIDILRFLFAFSALVVSFLFKLKADAADDQRAEERLITDTFTASMNPPTCSQRPRHATCGCIRHSKVMAAPFACLDARDAARLLQNRG